jgi:hypothetical protein
MNDYKLPVIQTRPKVPKTTSVMSLMSLTSLANQERDAAQSRLEWYKTYNNIDTDLKLAEVLLPSDHNTRTTGHGPTLDLLMLELIGLM